MTKPKLLLVPDGNNRLTYLRLSNAATVNF